jgi:predicted SnoaL-like aldol condensation-catalyzing enzyme
MATERKDSIRFLLKGIESGDPESVAVVNPNKYIQHNPQTREGGEGLAALFKRISKTSPRVNIVRMFSDKDYVFAHTEYEFDTSRIGFEVFRFEGNQTVEHWDNIQLREGPNPSGHSMVDGLVEVSDLALTESNRKLVTSFVELVLVKRDFARLCDYVDDEAFVDHHSNALDGGEALLKLLSSQMSNEHYQIQYDICHRVLAEGNFVLSVSEGYLNGKHTSFYDLFRVQKGKLVEHWDTTETVPAIDQWKNNNGKF